ncbi:MAG TPA: TrmH family RNA methyltransferase [Anaerolineae bacterium]|nr:TrmH family RNA methyltransferase [Anaerolineae bacterium]HQI84893.1 TrmH family RNA methyltransferase [Anaerolineae bacterium]
MITSLKNDKIKLVRALAEQRRERNQHKLFFIEGVAAIRAAYLYDWDVRWLIYCPEVEHTEWGLAVIAQTPLEARLEVNEYVLTQLSDREMASELLAVVAQRPDDLARIPLKDDLLVLLLDRPSSPGNLGSTIRSADALGADAVLITGHATDVYDPKTVRASIGSLFALPVLRVPEHDALEAWLATARDALGRVQVVATSSHAKVALYDHDLTGPTVVAIGNETVGLSHYFETLCNAYVTIPMYGSATSFNASVAASIFLYEARRQRAQKPPVM